MKYFLLAIAALILGAAGFLLVQQQAEKVQLDESNILRRFELDGTSCVLHQGDFYKDHGNGSFSFIENYYRPDFYESAYTHEGDAIYFHSPDDPSKRVRIRNEYQDDFESYSSVRDLVISDQAVAGKETLVDGIKSYDPLDLPTRWMSITLQSPKSPSVKDYVEHRNQIAAGGDFVENRIEPSTEQAHSGKQSIRFTSVAPSRSMICAKSSMSSNVFHFAKGDDFWFSAWFYFQKGMPLTVMDLESTWLNKQSGIRIMFSESGSPCVELKAFEKPKWRNNDFTVSRNQWVQVKAHFHVDDEDGKIRLWIDDELVIDGSGQTLPLADSILDSIEVGISATLDDCVIFLDDVVVSRHDEAVSPASHD